MEICPGCNTIAAQAVVSLMPLRLSPTLSSTLLILIHLTIPTIITMTIAVITVVPQIIHGEILATICPMDFVARLIASSAYTRGHQAHCCQTHGMTPKPPVDARLREDRITMKILVITVVLLIILGEILATICPMDFVAQLIASSAYTRGHQAHFCQTHGMTLKPTADARLREDRITMKILVITVPP